MRETEDLHQVWLYISQHSVSFQSPPYALGYELLNVAPLISVPAHRQRRPMILWGVHQ
jgi:hypothetical protein